MLAEPMTISTPDNRNQFDAAKLLAGIGEKSGLSLDSRKIQPGDVFIAIPGLQEHGLVHARQAIEHGASAIIYDPAEGGNKLAQELASREMKTISLMEQPHLKDYVGLLASSFYQHPSHQLDVVGITGTNGKTSCSHFIAQAISALNQQDAQSNQCGYIGTLGWGVAGNNQPTTNTTPDAIELHRILAELKSQHVGTVAMEVSSHGLAQNRLQGVALAGAVFTNLGRDHLDYHQSAESYLNAKLKLFHTNGLRFAVINQDDPVAPKVLDVLAEQVRVIGFSLRSSSHLSADQLTIENVRLNGHDTKFEVFFRGQKALASLPLIGEFNIANALATVGVMLGLGVDFSEAIDVLQHLTAVAGRMDKVSDDNDQIAVYVDYAHTPDALSVALQTVRQHCTGKVRVVFGCGGNRDQGKRKQMGEVASNQADYVVLTDDNPRFESGEQIIKDIVDGCGKKSVEIIQNRSAAIQSAIFSAAPGDTVLIAGKGHETTQETNGQILPHDDRQIAKAMLAMRDKTHSLDSVATWQQKQ